MKKIYFFSLFLIIVYSCNCAAQLEYKDVAPIFYKRCTSCHHENQHAPSLLNYFETSSLASHILAKLQTGEMPPWSPDTTYTRFTHERLITDVEKNDIISWINHGTLTGDTTLAPTPPTYSQYQLNGIPTLELRTGPFVSNATVTDSYVCFSVPSGLTTDRILQAYEIVPGNAAIVHHVVVAVDTLGTSTNDLSGTCFNIFGQVGIGAYAPGAPATVFPSQFPLKAGIRIKAGSNIVLQIHYPSGTSGQIDSTKIRMYFYPVGTTGVRTIYDVVPMQNWNLDLPANTVTPYTAIYPSTGGILADISMFAVFPHSHKICRNLINYAYMGTDTIPLIRINNWAFDWQGFYTYNNLIKVPAGYKLFSEHIYDNTTANPHNPNSPPQHVYAGLSTTDEMLFDAIQFLLYQPGDELIDVATLLKNDPLYNNLNENISTNNFELNAYPNPSTEKLFLSFSKQSSYTIRLYCLTGVKIFETKIENDNTSIDVKNILKGMYILESIDNKSLQRINRKVILGFK